MVACARTTQGKTTVGDFVMVQLYIVQLFAPLANLGGSYRMMMQAATDVEKMAELLHTPVEIVDRHDAVDLAQVDAPNPNPNPDPNLSEKEREVISPSTEDGGRSWRRIGGKIAGALCR